MNAKARYRRRRSWHSIVTTLAAVVVFVTTYALILPAITMEKEPTCGIEEHTHEESCFASQVSLSCSVHSHGDTCRNEAGELICGMADFVVHTHDASCYLEDGTLLCTLPEITAHTHDESCVLSQTTVHQHDDSCVTAVKGDLICTEEENTGHTHGTDCWRETEVLTCTIQEGEGHSHGEGCFEEQTTQICPLPESEGHSHTEDCLDEEGTVVCGLEESEGHTHGAECFTTESVLICTTAESEPHIHGDACRTTEASLVCGLEETSGHSHEDACYAWTEEVTCGMEEGQEISSEPVPVCTLEEIVLHTHSDGCYGEDGTLSCGMLQVEAHVHSEACLTASEEQAVVCGQEEHTHDEVLCYIDNTADVETEEQWKDTLPKNLSHIWAEDLLAVAESQLGYTESVNNVQVDAAGLVRGYTRYGAWYGEPYSDWNSIFVSFCLHYAGIDREAIAYESNAERWVTVLTAREQYAAADAYTPVPGDLVFMDLDDNGFADTVGIVKSLEESILTVYQGDTENRSVEKLEYLLADAPVETEQKVLLPGDLLGYGILPENPNPDGEPEETTEATEATEPEAVYYCGQEAHTHGEACYDANGNVICELAEHTHEDACTVAPVRYCGKMEHTHDDSCLDEEGNVVCTLEVHTHTEECDVSPEDGYFCGDTEHEHTILCKANLTDLSEEDRQMVSSVILRIDAMPSADEIDAKIEEFEEAGDYEGEEAWLTEVYRNVGDVYIDYMLLNNRLQAYVVNAEKLLELEYIWSVQVLLDNITSDAPTPISSASTAEFIELNLYDYNSQINTNYNLNRAWPGFQWNGGAYVPGATSANTSAKTYNRNAIDFIDFGNSFITDNSYGGNTYSFSENSVSKNRWNIGNQGGNINAIVQYPTGDYANKPVGMSNGTEVLGRNLTTGGYPWVTDAGSMVDYFSNSTFATKLNSSSIDGLFQIDGYSGEYYYNSRWNHAQYSNNKFTLYEDIITPNFITYPFGNFLPLNDITNSSNATQVGAIGYGMLGSYVQGIINDLWYDSNYRNQTTGAWLNKTADQLVAMLAKYRYNLRGDDYSSDSGDPWVTWSAKDAIYDYIGNGPTDDTGPITDALLEKMYNIDWDVATNFFFGMEMKMHFMQPKGGITGNDIDGDGDSDFPMIFYFTGDDDVWVYIDGVLFLDLSGIHRHVGGEIDFVNGEVHYYALSPETGDVSTTPYTTYTFAELLTAAGKSTDGLNANGTFTDYSTHDFNFYYMERGSGSSVCRLNFNFPLLKKNTISVNKENLVVNESGTEVNGTVNGNPDYYFNIVDTKNNLFVGPGSVTGISQYKIMDSAGNILLNEDGTEKVFTTDQYGIFTLKAGQTAVFENIPENSGEYFVQELIKAEDNDQYPNVYVNSTITRYNKLIEWNYREYFVEDPDSGYDASVPTKGPYGYEWYGRSGQDTDSSTNSSFYFKQQNHVDISKLGELSIAKVLDAYSDTVPDAFKMQVALDGVPLPVGTAYTLSDGSNKTVTETGIVEVPHGMTATIPNIVSGTKFTVVETGGSADGYIVTYDQQNADEYAELESGGVEGVVRVDTNVLITVTNAEKGAEISIPVTKSLSKSDGTEHTYTFNLVEVTDSSGQTEKEDGISKELSLSVLNTPVENAFTLKYSPDGYTELPLKHYYRVTENMAAETMTNTTTYVVEVTIKGTDGGNIAANVTGIWKDGAVYTGETLAYTNTLVGSLELSKTVSGMDTDRGFVFSIHLEPGDSGTVLPDVYPAIFYQKDGTEVTTTVSRNADGNIVLSDFKSGEKAVICGIPIGSTWTITEESADGFLTTWTVTVGEDQTSGQGTTATGDKIGIGKTEVAYVNTAMYELPETGGAGTQLYTMGGLMLMISAVVLLLYSQRRRRKEDF